MDFREIKNNKENRPLKKFQLPGGEERGILFMYAAVTSLEANNADEAFQQITKTPMQSGCSKSSS